MNTKIKIISHRLFIPFVLICFLSLPAWAKKKEDNTMVLKHGWVIQSSEKVKETGDIISQISFKPDGWYPAKVPSSVLGSLVADGIYKDVFVGKNLASIPEDQFKNSWWYRTEFSVPAKKGGEFVKLAFDGINYRSKVTFLLKRMVPTSPTSVPETFLEVLFFTSAETVSCAVLSVFRSTLVFTKG